MDFPVGSTIAAIAYVAFALIAVRLIGLASRGRLLRCPETGGVAFVEVDPRSAKGKSARTGVCECDLWPQKQGCAQGCLARYAETAPGHRVALRALRPFARS